MSIVESIIRKRGIRSDALWSSSYVWKGFLRYIPLALDTWALLRTQFFPRDKIDALVDDRLKQLFREVRHIPLWQETLDRICADAPREMLARIPITTKNMLNDEHVGRVSDGELLTQSEGDSTSGSTGKPFHFFHDRFSMLRSFAVTERIFRTATRGVRYPIVYMRARERAGFTFYKHEWFFVRGYTGIAHRMEEFKHLASRYPRGFILYGYTSWIAETARLMEKEGISLPIRAVMVAGEHLTANDRALIERVMKAELFTLYASREAGFLGFECEKHLMHIAEEWALLEIVDDEGRVLPAGEEGRILVTVFDNRVMPCIRYDIGDRGVISNKPCACGRTLRTLQFKGRTAERIELDGGRVVPLLDVASLLDLSWDAVHQFQIIQTAPRAFTFKIIPGPLFERRKARLEARLRRLLHPELQIQWELVEHIPAAQSGKAVYFLRDYTRT